MADWFPPKTWGLEELFTSEDANKYIRDNSQYIHDTKREDLLQLTGYDVWALSIADTYIPLGLFPYPFINFEKRHDDTLVRCRFSLTMFTEDEPTLCAIQMNVDGALSGTSLPLLMNITLCHTQWTGVLELDPIDAGTYTITPMIGLAFGGPVRWDHNDYFNMEVFEVSTS